MERVIDHPSLERRLRDLTPHDPPVSPVGYDDQGDLVRSDGPLRSVGRIDGGRPPVVKRRPEPQGPSKEASWAEPQFAVDPVEPAGRATGRDQRAHGRTLIHREQCAPPITGQVDGAISREPAPAGARCMSAANTTSALSHAPGRCGARLGAFPKGTELSRTVGAPGIVVRAGQPRRRRRAFAYSAHGPSTSTLMAALPEEPASNLSRSPRPPGWRGWPGGASHRGRGRRP